VRRSIIPTLVAAFASVAVVVPAAAADGPAPSSGTAGTTSVTLPLFTVPLTIDISTGPGGALDSVAVNPADGFVATALKPNKVVFVNDAAGTKVVVRSGHGGQKVETKAGSLDDIAGPGSWSGDLFGDGTITTVSWVVGATAEGAPDITDIATSVPDAEVGEVRHDTKSHDGDESASAAVKIRFVAGSQARQLGIRVVVSTDDGTSRAKTSVTLSRIRGVALPADEVAGPHQWTGLLCDGSQATIDYVVGIDGSISDVVVAPDTAKVRGEGRGIEVRFEKRSAVRIRVTQGDGTLRLRVDERIRCRADAPTVNTPTSVPTKAEEGSKAESRGSNGDGERRRNRGGGSGGNDRGSED
jgi:hypothetical protein